MMARVAAKRPRPMYKAGLVDKVVERASMVPDFTLPLAPSNFTCSSGTYPKKADVAVAGFLCFVTEILLNFALSTSYEFTNHNSTLKKKSYDRSYVRTL